MKPNTEVKIRRIQEEDISAIVEIDQQVSGHARTPSWPQRASSHFRTYFPPLSYVAEVEGKVVGFILGDVRGAEYALPLSGWIDIMGVAPEYQGKGIGWQLVETFCQTCRQRGVKARVVVRESDQRLRRFLSRAGFQRGELVEFVRG